MKGSWCLCWHSPKHSWCGKPLPQEFPLIYNRKGTIPKQVGWDFTLLLVILHSWWQKLLTLRLNSRRKTSLHITFNFFFHYWQHLNSPRTLFKSLRPFLPNAIEEISLTLCLTKTILLAFQWHRPVILCIAFEIVHRFFFNFTAPRKCINSEPKCFRTRFPRRPFLNRTSSHMWPTAILRNRISIWKPINISITAG